MMRSPYDDCVVDVLRDCVLRDIRRDALGSDHEHAPRLTRHVARNNAWYSSAVINLPPTASLSITFCFFASNFSVTSMVWKQRLAPLPTSPFADDPGSRRRHPGWDHSPGSPGFGAAHHNAGTGRRSSRRWGHRPEAAATAAARLLASTLTTERLAQIIEKAHTTSDTGSWLLEAGSWLPLMGCVLPAPLQFPASQLPVYSLKYCSNSGWNVRSWYAPLARSCSYVPAISPAAMLRRA